MIFKNVLQKFKIKRERVKSKLGFTLIELLIVIAIIGLLSSVVLASLNSAKKKARDARRILNIAQFQKALEFYYDANGTYPNVVQSADSDVCENRFPTLDNYLSNYLPSIPHDPLGPGGRYCYYYNVKKNGQGYVIMALQVELAETSAKGEGTRCYQDTTNVYCKGVNY